MCAASLTGCHAQQDSGCCHSPTHPNCRDNILDSQDQQRRVSFSPAVHSPPSYRRPMPSPIPRDPLRRVWFDPADGEGDDESKLLSTVVEVAASSIRPIRTPTESAMSSSNQHQQPPLQPGAPAPAFACKAMLPDQSFADVQLSDYLGKYVVLFFYPADFTFVCPTEIVAFSERADEFASVNCQLLACSTDSHFVHLAWSNTGRKDGGIGRLNFPVLADRTQAICRAYGVLKADEGVAYRGLFIISDTGTLRQITVNDLPVGRSVDETLRLVQAFQFTDRYGEVCPANWRPGGRTMKPDVGQSKEYFQSA